MIEFYVLCLDDFPPLSSSAPLAESKRKQLTPSPGFDSRKMSGGLNRAETPIEHELTTKVWFKWALKLT
jgi:hypothetical protein